MTGKFAMTFLFLSTITFTSWSQVELGGDEPKKEEKKEVVKPEKQKDGSTEVYFVSNWSNTSRKLVENDAPFGDSLGQRAFESSLNRWSFGIGFRNRINDHFAIQGGISFIRNGESYLFEDADSLFTYNTTYSYIGMPIKALYTYGEDIMILSRGGITRHLFTSYLQEREWRESADATDTEEIKEQNGYSSFALSAAFNVGVQLKFSDNWTLLFMPEYRIQLTNSYEKTDSYKHFGRALGFDIGLTLKL